MPEVLQLLDLASRNPFEIVLSAGFLTLYAIHDSRYETLRHSRFTFSDVREIRDPRALGCEDDEWKIWRGPTERHAVIPQQPRNPVGAMRRASRKCERARLAGALPVRSAEGSVVSEAGR